jgi:beta-galactosidase
LDEAIAILSQERLKIILGTPTATPPKCLVDRHPEMRQVADELTQLSLSRVQQAPVALLFDYEAKWLLDIQPQGADFDYLRLAYEFC